MEKTKDEPFENQLKYIDSLSTPKLTSVPPKKPKMTRAQTKAVIRKAVKDGDIPANQGRQLLRTLGLVKRHKNKKVIDSTQRKQKRSAKKQARKGNR
jgi:polyhydroxyalkanoate synthesis regulator phasin